MSHLVGVHGISQIFLAIIKKETNNNTSIIFQPLEQIFIESISGCYSVSNNYNYMNPIYLLTKTDSHIDVKTMGSNSMIQEQQDQNNRNVNKQLKKLQDRTSKSKNKKKMFDKSNPKSKIKCKQQTKLINCLMTKKYSNNKRNSSSVKLNNKSMSLKKREQVQQSSRHNQIQLINKNLKLKTNNISAQYQNIIINTQPQNYQFKINDLIIQDRQQIIRSSFKFPKQFQFNTQLIKPRKIKRQLIHYSYIQNAQILNDSNQNNHNHKQDNIKYKSVPKQVVKEIELQNYQNQKMRTQLTILRNQITKYDYLIRSSSKQILNLKDKIKTEIQEHKIASKQKNKRNNSENPEQQCSIQYHHLLKHSNLTSCYIDPDNRQYNLSIPHSRKGSQQIMISRTSTQIL